ncbi:MAG TPA: class I SAM-dependent methyltransferase [Actinomycetes bacterium]|nr:class I SAM-dependent methyltransferase [Actinomycetes bacterium]
MALQSPPVGYPCRFCAAPVSRVVCDLGASPLCESFLTADQLNQMEPFYPLRADVCEECWLVQLERYVAPEAIFTEYAYFSSYSDSWVRHARDYTDLATERLGLGPGSLVVELASNDGYLLQHFVAKGVPVLGIEPARNVAEVAIERGVPTLTEFFGEELAGRLAGEGRQADLVVANNVLAQVPDLNSFVAGIARLLKPGGVVTVEFPHLARLMDGNQFDTIYHEHFSYFSFGTARRIFARHGLDLFDVEELPTHGGSLRIWGRHAAAEGAVSERVAELAARELAAGLETPAPYAGFGQRVVETKRKLLEFLIAAKAQGASIAGYGAPGKGNTLLNYCGIRTDFLDYTVDRNPYKHGRFTPGTHIPIHPPERLAATRPDYILILPWNLKDEIIEQLAYTRDWGARFVVPIPEVTVYGNELARQGGP